MNIKKGLIVLSQLYLDASIIKYLKAARFNFVLLWCFDNNIMLYLVHNDDPRRRLLRRSTKVYEGLRESCRVYCATLQTH